MAGWPKKIPEIKDALDEYPLVDGPSAVAKSINQRMMDQMRDAIMYGHAQPGKLGWPPNILASAGSAPKMEPNWSTGKLLELIHMRMHRDRPRDPGMELVPDFSFIAPYKNGETVVVFIVHDKKPTYIEDDWNLFPSDALITKLRLLLG